MKLLYIGRAVHSEPPHLRQSWYVLESQEFLPIVNDGSRLKWEAGRAVLFPALRPHTCPPGTIFLFDQADEEEDRIDAESARDPDRWKNDLDVARWEINHKVAEQILKGKSISRRLSKDSKFHELLKPLRFIYFELPPSHRNAFLLMVLDGIQH